MHYWNDGSSVGWWWMLPMMLLFLVVVFGAVWLLVNSNRSHGAQGPQSPTPEEVLAHRLARGEIDAAEYRERLDALRTH